MARNSYVDLNADLKPRLFSSVSAVQSSGANLNPSAPPDAQRDNLLVALGIAVSRRFEQETDRVYNAFAPYYDVRLFSGTGSQLLEIDEYSILSKVELNTTPGNPASPTWTDISGDLASGAMQQRPIRYWPKDTLFRMTTFYQDPYLGGNLRITGLWGEAQPDPGATEPTAGQTVDNLPGTLTQSQIDALRPPGGGWWTVPDDVVKACAEWTIYTYHAARAAYGDTASNEAAGGMLYRKGIPPEVQLVITSYKERKLHLAMITTDGVDIELESARYGTPGALSRWAGWQTP